MCYFSEKQTANNKQLSLKFTHMLLFIGNLPDTYQDVDFSEWHIVCACQKSLDSSSALYEMIFCDWKKNNVQNSHKKDSSLSKIEANNVKCVTCRSAGFFKRIRKYLNHAVMRLFIRMHNSFIISCWSTMA